MKIFYEIENFKQLTVHTSYGKLRDLLYEINGIIIRYQKCNAFPLMVECVLEELIAVFKKVSELQPQSEGHITDTLGVLNDGRILVRSLLRYNQTFQYDQSCVDAVIRSAKYQVWYFLKNRDKLDVNSAFVQLRLNQQIKKTINIINEKLGGNINITSFNLLQGDIISLIQKMAESYAFAA